MVLSQTRVKVQTDAFIFFPPLLSFSAQINPVVMTDTHLVMCFWERAMAYSATTVLPADVCAATNTESWFSSLSMACFWKTSSSNGH